MIKASKAYIKKFAASLLTEGLEPGSAGIAVGLGIFIGIVPIYGLQTLAAIGLAILFGLNKPLTVAATFINNPLLQPFLVIGSVECGSFLRTGAFHPWHLAGYSLAALRNDLFSWALGSIVLGVVAGAAGALLTAVALAWLRPAHPGLRARIRYVNGVYAAAPSFDRGFVRWKMRLDRIFSLLEAEGLGSGTAVDLGCGYGMALCFAAYGQEGRQLAGCDLDPRRIAVAQKAMASFAAGFEVCDVRQYPLPQAGLILILDVLQYLSAEEQLALVGRCAAALEPGGKFVFRVHDREHGLRSALTMLFDRLIFKIGNAPNRPLMLAPDAYRSALEAAGLRVRMTRFRNLLPLAHILIVAERPRPESAP
jgi:uncharacterized protein (DUF2062 family)